MPNATNLSPAHDADVVMSDAMDAEEIFEQELFELAAKSRSAVRPPGYQTVALPQVAFPLASSFVRMAEDPPHLDAALEADIFEMYAAREAKREARLEKNRVLTTNWYYKHREEINANKRAATEARKRKRKELAEALANASSTQEREMIGRQIEEPKSKMARTQKEKREELAKALANASSLIGRQIEELKSKRARAQKETRQRRKAKDEAAAVANASSPQEREMIVAQNEERKSKRARQDQETGQRRAKDEAEAEAVAELEAAVANASSPQEQEMILLLLAAGENKETRQRRKAEGEAKAVAKLEAAVAAAILLLLHYRQPQQ